MPLKVSDNLLTSTECFNCKKCCQYEPDELVDAPMFTPEQRKKLETEFKIMDICFEQVGKLWRIILDDIRGSEKKICPLYNWDNGHCLGYSLEIFDCLTWPFYIMKSGTETLITVSTDCPTVNAHDSAVLKEYAINRIGPRMFTAAQSNPDLITTLHGNISVLCHINELKKHEKR
jgi:Fe-S-cluster containining protein